MGMDTIKKRSEIAEEYTWELRDIFESDESWSRELEALKMLSPRIAAFQGRLGESAETLLDFLRLDDELSLRLGKLMSYASMKSDQDTAEGFYQDIDRKSVV